MMLVRPVTLKDQDKILTLAREAGIGMTSLPPDAQVLEHKIRRSVASCQGKPDGEKQDAFLFVLVDTETNEPVGTTGVVAHVGLRHPFYSYKLSTIVQASKELGVYSLQRVLHMVNDYTGASEIGSLFLLPEYRRDGIGKFLSMCRFLMLAELPHLFADIVISEIRGVQDENGESPFYKHLAQHFFQMDFKRADLIHATQGGQFISDLMPKYPIYVNLLDAKAQGAIGVPLEASRPAIHLLEKQGFRYQGYIDVFDAGPTMQAERATIRVVRKSKRSTLTEIKPLADENTHMVSSTKLPDFRMSYTALEKNSTGISLTKETVEALMLKKGDAVRYYEI